MYQVDDKATGESMGYFYMDLHPRDGKYGHAAVWLLQPVFHFCGPWHATQELFQGSLDSAGERQKAVAAMVCNFPRAAADKPAFLKHRQVQTFFHEFGHIMHCICSRVSWIEDK